MASAIRLHGIPNCDTVKKARAWLSEAGLTYEFHDFKKSGLEAAALDRWIAAVGVEALVNRKGTTWRGLAAAVQTSAATGAGARALMLAHASVVKRPVVEWPDGRVSVGFDAAEWARLLGR